MIPMTTRNSQTLFGIAVLLVLVGCGHRTPQTTVEVIDTSMSIMPRAKKAALDAVQMQIEKMQRGDRLVILPITGDAANDLEGRILRLSAPTTRESYDTDLQRFRVQAKKQFAAWTASLDRHQSRTGILGTLDAARQELALTSPGSSKKLIIVTDFLEDDGTFHFVTDGSVATPARARALAGRLRAQHGFRVSGVQLCLGRLESSDYAPLSAQRKDAVNAFWEAYFARDENPVEIQVDGANVLADADIR
jgi:hypothetical protein